MYLCGYKRAIFYCTRLLHEVMHKIIVINQNAMISDRTVPGRRGVIICCQICNFGSDYGNINIFLSTDHI